MRKISFVLVLIFVLILSSNAIFAMEDNSSVIDVMGDDNSYSSEIVDISILNDEDCIGVVQDDIYSKTQNTELNTEGDYQNKIIYVGHNNITIDGNGSYENPYSTLKLACDNVNGEDYVTVKIFEGTHYFKNFLKFNTSNLNVEGIGKNVIIKNFYDSGGDENWCSQESFGLTSSSANFTISNLIFDASDFISDTAFYDAREEEESYFFAPFMGNANSGTYINCSFIGFKMARLTGSEYDTNFIRCSFDEGTNKILFLNSNFAKNSIHNFDFCMFHYDFQSLATVKLPVDIFINNVWFGKNSLGDFITVRAVDTNGKYINNYKIPVNRYAIFSVSENYLGNNQYEIVGKLTWNGTDNQEDMENFQPMTVNLVSTTGDINQTATLVNGTFRTVYTSSAVNHKVTATLDNEEIELEFTTVNITTNPVSIYYGEDQNITFTFTQPVTANVTVTVSNGNYNKSERVEIIGKDSLVYTVPDTLKSGSYHVEISLGENNLFGFNTTTLTVLKHDAYTFNTEIIDNGDIKVGDNVTVKVELPEDVSGNITIYVNGDPVVTKDALQNNEINVTALVAGDNIIIVTYNGDDKYDVKSTEPQVITAYKVVLPDGENKLDVKESTSPTVSINLPEDAEGNLTVTVGTKTYTQKLENGSATVNINDLPAGTYKAIVTYTGDGKYDEITTNINITVKEEAKTNTDNNTNVIVKEEKTNTNTNANSNSQKKTTPVSTKITAKNKKFKAKTKVKKYTITLKAGKKAVRKVTVTLKIKGKTYKAKTNAKGKATFKIKKLTKKGKHKAVIKFKGNKNYKASSKKVKITIK